MDAQEFKTLKPEYKELEGDDLWNAMEDWMLQQQGASETLKQIMPIWKTHTLRWLFYRQPKNYGFRDSHKDWYASNKACSSCHKGVSTRFGFFFRAEDGTSTYTSYCPHCHEEYKEEPNTTLIHKLYVAWDKTTSAFWLFLDKIHLVRMGFDRYGMFGDEARYVSAWHLDMETGKMKPIMKKRKWWEYVLIERRTHNF